MNDQLEDEAASRPPRPSRTGVVDCPHLPSCRPYECPNWKKQMEETWHES